MSQYEFKLPVVSSLVATDFVRIIRDRYSMSVPASAFTTGGISAAEVYVQPNDPGAPPAGEGRIWVQTPINGDPLAFDLKFWNPLT